MTLQELYEVAYGKVEPFTGRRKVSDFDFANIISFLVTQEIEKNDKIYTIDIYCYLLDKIGLDLNDLEYAYKRIDNCNENADLWLYKNYCNDSLFDCCRDSISKLPPYLLDKIGLDQGKYDTKTRKKIYHGNMFLTLRQDLHLTVLKENLKNKNYSDAKDCKTLEGYLNAIYSVDYSQPFLDKFAQRIGFTSEMKHKLVKKMLNECNSSKLYRAREILERNTQFKDQGQNDSTISISEKKTVEAEELNKLRKISEKIIGQEEAVTKVKNKILASFVGFQSENQPLATFLLTGPTGVGKTETAKAVANACFDGKIFVVDMTTFKSKGDISRLLGASPSYIGYDDKNSFCDFLEENPNSVILFDEIEKADRSCLDMLMRILDEGKFINAKGKELSLENTIVFCTTNLTEYQTQEASNVGESLTSGELGLRKEIVGRFSDVIEYKRLTKEECKQIAKQFLNKIIAGFERNNKNNLKLTYTDALVEKVVQEANTNLFGARDLKKTIQKYFVDRISYYIVEKAPQNESIEIDALGVNIIGNNIERVTGKEK